MTTTAVNVLLDLQVQVLHGVLPYLQSVRGKTFVLLCEGAVINDAVLRLALGRDVALLQLIGVRLVLVHGRLTQGASALEHQHQELLQVVSQHGCHPLSLMASDGGTCSQATGLLNLLQRSQAKDFVPVVKAVRDENDGHWAAVDAAGLAFELARQLKAHKLLLLTDEGRHIDGSLGNLFGQGACEVHGAAEPQGVKAPHARRREAGANAWDSELGCVHVIDGHQLHALLMEVLSVSGSAAAVVPRPNHAAS